jgi:hypothetical protein
MTITGSCHCGYSTRRIGVNARLFDDFDAALAPVVVIDGKHLW